MTIFSNLKLLNIVSKEFKLDIDGLHGIKHWESVYKNTKLLASYYNVNSDVFELFALLHDSMIAHQWRQPLSSISSAIARIKLKLLSKNLDDKFLQDSLKGINQYIQYLSSTIDDFRNLFSTDTKVELISLYDIVIQVYSLLDNSFSSQDIKIEIEKKKLSKKFIPKNELMQVIINVLNNAKDVFIERDIKNPIIKIYFKEDDDTQKIYIEDNAGGIEQSIVDKIFSPYFSTKTNKNGSGLGLYICKTILKRDNLGDIDLKVIDNGTQFIITIN